MATWACSNDITLTWRIYLKRLQQRKSSNWSSIQEQPWLILTLMRGIPILIVFPRHGNKMTDIRFKEHAMQLTEKNYSRSDMLSLTKKGFRPIPTWNCWKMLVTVFALVWMLFVDQYDYFQKVCNLWTILNSEQVYEKLDKFGPRMVRQITWVIIKDSRQHFFCTVTEE